MDLTQFAAGTAGLKNLMDILTAAMTKETDSKKVAELERQISILKLQLASPQSVAIGNNAYAAAGGVAIGDGARAGPGSVSIGYMAGGGGGAKTNA